MTKTIYALLVGVDEYLGGVQNLGGCKRDINTFNNYLEGRVEKDNNHYKAIILTDKDAKRDRVINAFRSHLGQAKKYDQAIFYFSGHGASTNIPEELKHLESDGRMESLVCHDSREGNHTDLVDKELAYLIYELSQKGPEITVILDCCHSGTGTRDIEAGIRQAKHDKRNRPLHTLLFMEDEKYASKLLDTNAKASEMPKGDHILIAACEAKQFAKERPINGEQKGVFSYFLLEALKKAGKTTTYRDIYMRVNSLVKANATDQVPQLETNNSDNLNRPFLGGAIQETPDHFTVSYDKDLGWVVDAGEIHGINKPKNDETTHFALFPFDATASDLRDLEKSTMSAEITEVMNTVSKVKGDGLTKKLQTYKAIVTSLPIAPLFISFTGDKRMVDTARSVLNSFGPGGSPSFLVQEDPIGKTATHIVDASENQLQIRRVEEVIPLVVGTKGFTKEAAEIAIDQLEHMARWHNLLGLTKSNGALDTNSVKLELKVKTAEGEWVPAETSEDVVLEYQEGGPLDAEAWKKPQFKLSLKNESDQRLFCMLFDLTEKYKINPITENDGVWIEPGQEHQLRSGKALEASIPKDYLESGKTTFQDTLKLIVATEESYASRLKQDELPIHLVRTRSLPKNIYQPDTLTRLMHRTRTRDIGVVRTAKISDWYALETTFTTVRPQNTDAVA